MSLARLQSQDVTGDFVAALDVQNVMGIIDKVALRVNAPTIEGFLGFTGGVPKPAVRSGSTNRGRFGAHRISYVNEVYDNDVEIDRNDMEADETGTLQGAIGDLAESYKLHVWEEMISLQNNGTVSGNNSYDGQTFFDTDHNLGQGNQNNKVTASEVAALDVTTVTAPTPEEFVDALTGTIGHMLGFKDERDRALNRFAREFVTFVPVGMFGSAVTALAANNLDSGETNVIAALNGAGSASLMMNGWKIDVVADADFTDTDAMVVCRVDDPRRKPLVITEYRSVEAAFVGIDSSYYRDKKALLATTEWMGDFVYGEPLYAVHATFS